MNKLIKNQQGHGALIIVLIVVVCLALVGGGVWFALKARHGGSSLLPAKFTLSDKCDQNDKELCKFLNNFKNIKNYTVKGTTTAAGKTSQSTFVLDTDTKYQIINTTAGKEDYNVVSIGDTSYTKDYTDNKWFKETVKASDQTQQKSNFEFNTNDTTANTAQKTTYKSLGMEKCDNRTCFKYQAITPGSDMTRYLWFDDRDYLLRKTRMEMKDGTVMEETYAYDNAKVSAPSPVKEGSPTSSLPGAPSQADVNRQLQQLQSQMPDMSIPAQ